MDSIDTKTVISLIAIALSAFATIISLVAAVKARRTRQRFEQKLQEWIDSGL